MTEVNLKECCIHPVSYAQALMDRAEAAEAQRDTAWAELREIRTAINADENEATADEVRRMAAQLERAKDSASEWATTSEVQSKKLLEAHAQLATLQEMYRSDHDQRIRQEEQIKRLENELRIEAHQSAAMQHEINRLEWTPTVQAFERTAPIDWRPSEYDAETPLGHQYEESGEVD